MDVKKHNGELCGHEDFNGQILYNVIDGVSFTTEEDRAAFLAEFGSTYNAKAIDGVLKIGIRSF